MLIFQGEQAYSFRMKKSGNLNRLVSELNVDERVKLLEKLTSQSDLEKSPLYEEAAADIPIEDIETRFETLSWLSRLWFRIASIFTGRGPSKLYENHLMSGIAKSLEAKAPGFYNYQKDILLPKFQTALEKLRDGSRFFYYALDLSLNKEKGGLMVFLGSLEMPEIHTLIQNGINFPDLAERFPTASETELKQKAQKTMEDALGDISVEQKGNMYLHARSLTCLKQLAAFHFDRVINSFSSNSGFTGNTCISAAVRDQLATLNNILHSLHEPPSMRLLESLFVFVLSDKQDEPGFDVHTEMQKLLGRAEFALDAIREFNRQVPLTLFLRCMTRNMALVPQDTGGGEDWFPIYREHWRSLLNDGFLSFIKTKRQRDMQTTLQEFLKGVNIRRLVNMAGDTSSEGVPVSGTVCLSFLQTFYPVVFMGEINPILRPILLDGEFIRKENKTEFTECYNNIIKLEDIIKRFDRKLSPEGDYGCRYAQAKSEMVPLPVKRRKIQIILDEACAAADEILGQTKHAIEGMIKILGGIISGSEKYDSLANLHVIGKSPFFMDSIRLCIDRFTQTLKLMEDMDTM
jgi:hypothetical protein